MLDIADLSAQPEIYSVLMYICLQRVPSRLRAWKSLRWTILLSDLSEADEQCLFQVTWESGLLRAWPATKRRPEISASRISAGPSCSSRWNRGSFYRRNSIFCRRLRSARRWESPRFNRRSTCPLTEPHRPSTVPAARRAPVGPWRGSRCSVRPRTRHPSRAASTCRARPTAMPSP